MIKQIVGLIFASLLSLGALAGGGGSNSASIQWMLGEFTVTDFVKIYVDRGNKAAISAAQYLIRKMQPATGQRWRAIQTSATDPIPYAILLTTARAKPELNKQGYSLRVRSRSVVIRARSQQGLVNGANHFLQLLPDAINEPIMQGNVRWSVPAVDVTQVGES